MINVTAHAKVNLTLHVLGQRSNGYHELQSLVCLTEFGDQLFLTPAAEFSFTVTGPFCAGIPHDDSNLVVKAAQFMAKKYSKALTIKVVLEKNLPMASGIGGGSSDAVAMIKALSEYWAVPMPPFDVVMELGADLPVCMTSGFTLMEGAGEKITPLMPATDWGIVLVNPNVGISTPAVFQALKSKENPPMKSVATQCTNVTWLGDQRNDLEEPAIALVPEVADVIAALRTVDACAVARMSGSGATCFGIFPNETIARAAAVQMRNSHPNWWSVATKLV